MVSRATRGAAGSIDVLWRDERQPGTLTGMNYYEEVARTMLRRFGVRAIWQLHLAAAKADRAGNPLAALSMIIIADAAEQQWRTRKLADHA